ncbi:dienelactone hydrolase family protein [Segetibacter sp. 3557_3]|uniref:dienelactone hydrolase family protein n=1 Tax=Segetibacter sp. 3557_3 TaxID=2547429 RepID=UPI00105875AD|nr:dienelactone hydrolase family protein [Segetibacter sp. 3557_3]TDH26064.1 dienelactone hydrolase family protein [Segetibacter sp. 3557_3]
MFKAPWLFTVLCCAIVSASCNNGAQTAPRDKDGDTSVVSIKEEAVTYALDTVTLKGYITYDQNSEAVRPAVLVLPEWWGLNDYTRSRARQLASLGYIAMAVDMYGQGKIAADPTEAQALATPFYMNPQLTRFYVDAALSKLKTYKQADTSNLAAIGYCFGGYVALNAAKLGAPLQGVVSFHGSLGGVAPAKDLLKARVLVCHGGADNFVPDAEVNAFKKSMDSVGADYTVKIYPNATHAFTNPDATRTAEKFKMPIQYNPAADSASWNDMKAFFQATFKR